MKMATGRSHVVRAVIVGASIVLAGANVSCNGDFVANLTEEASGNITVSFNNNTRFRAVFAFGSWNSLDRTPPGPVSLQQLRIEARQTVAPATLPCRRNFAIGTDELLQRVIDTNGTAAAGFDPDVFVSVVNFSSADANSDAATLPTAGTAAEFRALLGVDYKCGDRLIFTFQEDAAAPGGFRIDFELLPSEEPDA